MVSEKDIERIVNRHVGRVMERLDEINTTTIAKDCVKREMWMISDDIKAEAKKEKEGE